MGHYSRKVKHVLTEKLGLAAQPDIERAHRVGRVLLVPEDALARLSVGFATGDKRT